MQRLRALSRQVPPLSLALCWLGGLGLVLALVASFVELAEDVWFREGFAWDAPLILALHQLSRPWLDTVMRIVTQTGEGSAIAVVIAAAAWFLWRRQVLDAYRAIGALDVARVDFRMDAAGRPYVLEINALPGINPELSDLCIYMSLLGIPYDWLINRILDLACARYGLPTSDAFAQPIPYDPPRPGELRIARVGEPNRTEWRTTAI